MSCWGGFITHIDTILLIKYIMCIKETIKHVKVPHRKIFHDWLAWYCQMQGCIEFFRKTLCHDSSFAAWKKTQMCLSGGNDLSDRIYGNPACGCSKGSICKFISIATNITGPKTSVFITHHSSWITTGVVYCHSGKRCNQLYIRESKKSLAEHYTLRMNNFSSEKHQQQ